MLLLKYRARYTIRPANPSFTSLFKAAQVLTNQLEAPVVDKTRKTFRPLNDFTATFRSQPTRVGLATVHQAASVHHAVQRCKCQHGEARKSLLHSWGFHQWHQAQDMCLTKTDAPPSRAFCLIYYYDHGSKLSHNNWKVLFEPLNPATVTLRFRQAIPPWKHRLLPCDEIHQCSKVHGDLCR